ncbi:MAG: glycosyltransferase [Deltaproteobacteria bacterium]|nr:glycosyltransferase [Deltaproteobacteria bacterium]
MNPTLSIVVPARNVARWIDEAVRSALGSRLACEVLVVDDGSSDDTCCRVEQIRDSRVRVVRQRPLGLSSARNRGITEATGQFISFLDGDDCVLAAELDRAVSRLARTEAWVIYGETMIMDSLGRVFGARPPPLFAPRPEGDVLRALLARNFIASTGATAIRRIAFESVGRYAPELVRAQDWEMWCRLAAKGRFLYAGPRPILLRRVRVGSVSATIGLSAAEMLRTIEVVFSNADVVGAIPRERLRTLERMQIAFAHVVAGTECLRARRFDEARRALARALAMDPTRPEAGVLLLAALARRLPSSLERRLK